MEIPYEIFEELHGPNKKLAALAEKWIACVQKRKAAIRNANLLLKEMDGGYEINA